jgi:branched-chain amino acid transport system permease protein
MTFDIALLLAQDGIVNGAIYALLALSTVLVFRITRVIFIPSGTLVAFAALTLATLQAGKCPATVWLLVGGGLSVAALDLYQRCWRTRRDLISILFWNVGYPLALATGLQLVTADQQPVLVQVVLCCLILVPLGPILYRLVYTPVAAASVLVLLIVSIAVDVALVSFGLLFFGSDGTRAPPMIDVDFPLGPLTVTGQSLVILGTSLALIGVLYVFFEHTLEGKALLATAVNRIGARLMGISTDESGKRAFALATFIAVCAGVLAAPTTTIYYDTGFLIGLRGLVGAIFGGLASYPLAAVGAILIGIIESVAAFEASAFKEVIVFSLLIPILLTRTLVSDDQGHDEE